MKLRKHISWPVFTIWVLFFLTLLSDLYQIKILANIFFCAIFPIFIYGFYETGRRVIQGNLFVWRMIRKEGKIDWEKIERLNNGEEVFLDGEEDKKIVTTDSSKFTHHFDVDKKPDGVNLPLYETEKSNHGQETDSHR